MAYNPHSGVTNHSQCAHSTFFMSRLYSTTLNISSFQKLIHLFPDISTFLFFTSVVDNMAAFYTFSINLRKHTVALSIFPKLPLQTHDALGNRKLKKAISRTPNGSNRHHRGSLCGVYCRIQEIVWIQKMKALEGFTQSQRSVPLIWRGLWRQFVLLPGTLFCDTYRYRCVRKKNRTQHVPLKMCHLLGILISLKNLSQTEAIFTSAFITFRNVHKKGASVFF